jgi:hypothetical protein
MIMVDLDRQCPLCLGADQHAPRCVLEGREHVYLDTLKQSVDWNRTLDLNGMDAKGDERVEAKK